MNYNIIGYKSVAMWNKIGKTEDTHILESTEKSKIYAESIVKALKSHQHPDDEKIRGKLIESWIEPLFDN